MANCHDLFIDFNDKIVLTEARKKDLESSRDKIRNKIRDYYSENHPDTEQPKFASQGSFQTNTIVNPIPRKEEDKNGDEIELLQYDVDDGVYFIGDKKEEDRKTIQTYHDRIFKAVEGHTNNHSPMDKNPCIRVIFHDGHNIDLPIYYKENSVPELAHKKEGWIDSDPKEFTDWFEQQVGKNKQLKRIVRYLKAWADYREYQNKSVKMPSGLVLTILAANNFSPKGRDDIALKNTLESIQTKLKFDFRCDRPTTPSGENLLEDYTQEDYFMDHLGKIVESAQEAIGTESKLEACKKWENHLGDRFCCGEIEEEEDTKALAALASGSKPWRSF